MDVPSADSAVHDEYISGLSKTFSEALHVQDCQKSEYAYKGDDNGNNLEENLCLSFSQEETKLDTKCLKKSATFPIPHTTFPSSSSEEETDTSFSESHSEHLAHQIYSRSISLPAPLNLKSAMKGSRKKDGVSPTKLRVKWAPDVYDPVPTLVSHTVKNKKHLKSRKKKTEKKNGKKGQKGSSSRGTSGKDKKQVRRVDGTPDLCYKSLDSHDKVIEASSEFDAFDVRCQDSYCGTSFLKKSVTEVHFSVAEAQ